ncbi:DUF1178 family protein [Azovibrio restrictus]|uniref:DUF1178 family protein n=1 Tax=Azovibrio restrictus TaxID=146938 RepID=UPI0026F0405E|nr:DUF1178 family protein [Azovibrio restrictus]
MIIFDLSCEQGHRFEGWFASHADFEAQQERGLVLCPQCNSRQVRRIPSASHIATTPLADRAVPNPLQFLHSLKEAILRNSEDVGHRFAEEARRIHYAEAPARTIRGKASPKEFLELQEEGIEVVPLPILVDKENLN